MKRWLHIVALSAAERCWLKREKQTIDKQVIEDLATLRRLIEFSQDKAGRKMPLWRALELIGERE